MSDSPIDKYVYSGPAEESCWRSVVLFGKNTASYKFALAQSVIELAKQGKSIVSIDELAAPYAANICRHAKAAPRQSTNRTNAFLRACSEFNEGAISRSQLIDATVRHGFNYVLDAFHNVNGSQVPVQFFQKDFSRAGKRLVLTDAAFRLAESSEAANIMQETESRWNLVETAWEQGISSSLLRVAYDEDGQELIAESGARRKPVTSARGSLNGYQKGHCFYCYAPILAAGEASPNGLILPGRAEAPLCDVDHFYPHALASQVPEVNWDGVWNLVLACPECNRGQGGKFARVPAQEYAERLNRRNECLIASHHPLRETLIAQTGATPAERWNFLKKVDKVASDLLPGSRWRTEQREAPAF